MRLRNFGKIKIEFLIRFILLMGILGLIPALFQCQKHTPEEESIIGFIEQHRQEKDHFFKNDPNSPLLPEDKATFTGLKYYPIDLSLRFEGPLIRLDTTLIDTIRGTREGDLRPALRYGYFDFLYHGKRYRLVVYKMLRDNPQLEKYLFLGFTDETSGKETYGGGRYIDLIENPNNYYVVDFNLAYNPYCAYNPRYTCAIPPSENHLPFPVTAGEKIYKEH
ncbi:MAG: DUF1684 domain-containing protein [Calditrichaeota bacterium]|nr:MAG: DUF1684 domain-containing protein [Calditrichota bacterium]